MPLFGIICFGQEDSTGVSLKDAGPVSVRTVPDQGLIADDSSRQASVVDTYVNSLKIKDGYATDIEILAHLLTDTFSTDSMKMRAVFYWMTQNISYDVKKYHNKKFVPFKCSCKAKKTSHSECIDKWHWELAREALITRKGVCLDYALLFYYLCDFAGIECRCISGLAASGDQKLRYSLSRKSSNHTWNAVKLKDNWYLLDVTWASGYCDKNIRKFTKELNERYYLVSPRKMILNHHPVEKKWQLLAWPVRMKKFIARYNSRI